jgi:hypothetical protein
MSSVPRRRFARGCVCFVIVDDLPSTRCDGRPSTTTCQVWDGQVWDGQVEVNASLKVRANFVPIDRGNNGVGPQSLHLGIRNPKPQFVASGTVAVYGFPKSLRVLPTVLLMPDPREVKKTFAISHSISSGETTVMDLGIDDDLSTVTRIDIESLTYSDGSEWHPREQQSCLARGRTQIDASASVAPR